MSCHDTEAGTAYGVQTLGHCGKDVCYSFFGNGWRAFENSAFHVSHHLSRPIVDGAEVQEGGGGDGWVVHLVYVLSQGPKGSVGTQVGQV